MDNETVNKNNITKVTFPYGVYDSSSGLINLSGLYKNNTPIWFNQGEVNISNIKKAIDTEFKFIIRFVKNTNINNNLDDSSDLSQTEIRDNIIEYWTSDLYYTLLEESIRNNNPYLSIRNSIIVDIGIYDLIRKIIPSGTNRNLELQEGVIFEDTLGIPIDDSINSVTEYDLTKIDFNKICNYIDSSVKSANLSTQATTNIREYANYTIDRNN